MSRRNTRDAKTRRRQVRQEWAEWPAFLPRYLATDEAYLEHILSTPEAQLSPPQRQLAREIRAHHPGNEAERCSCCDREVPLQETLCLGVAIFCARCRPSRAILDDFDKRVKVAEELTGGSSPPCPHGVTERA